MMTYLVSLYAWILFLTCVKHSALPCAFTNDGLWSHGPQIRSICRQTQFILVYTIPVPKRICSNIGFVLYFYRCHLRMWHLALALCFKGLYMIVRCCMTNKQRYKHSSLASWHHKRGAHLLIRSMWYNGVLMTTHTSWKHFITISALNATATHCSIALYGCNNTA